MQNQILRNNLGQKVQSVASTRIGIKFTIFFIITTIVFSTASFIGGFMLKTYIVHNNNSVTLSKEESAQEIKKTIAKEYEISLGAFHNKSDAQDFMNKIGELNAAMEKTKTGYIVKLKDKFDFQNALSTSEAIKSEYKIISTLIEKEKK